MGGTFERMLADGSFQALFEKEFTEKLGGAITKAVEQVATAGNAAARTSATPSALTTPVDAGMAVSADLIAATIGSFVVCEEWAKTAGSKDAVRIMTLEKNRDAVVLKIAALTVYTRQVVHDASPEALRARAQENILQDKLAKARREKAEVETRIEDADERIAKAKGLPPPAGTSALDAIKKAHKSPTQVGPRNW